MPREWRRSGGHDDQFKQEPLQLLDLTEDSTADQSPDVDITAQPEDDVLALLRLKRKPRRMQARTARQWTRRQDDLIIWAFRPRCSTLKGDGIAWSAI